MIKVTNEYYAAYDERERFVSGDHSSVALFEDDHGILEVCGTDLELSRERLIDLRDVLVAAVDLLELESRLRGAKRKRHC